MRMPIKMPGELRRILREGVKTCRFVNLFLTSSCTCRCIMCNCWREKKAFIEKTVFQEAIDTLEGLGFYNYGLTGGEPLLHPQYFEFVKYIKKRGLYANSPTNGTLLTEKNVKKLKESGIDSVSVSIDSLNPNIADKVRSHTGQLAKALNGLRLLRKNRITHSALIILAKHNIHDYAEVIKKLDEQYDTPSILCFPDAGVGPLDEINFTKEDLIKVVEELMDLKRQGYRLMNTMEYLHELKRAYSNEKRHIPCYGGYYVINVYLDGSVTPCFNKGPICNIKNLVDTRLQKVGCQLCLNQCFIEFSYISECLRRKKFFTVWREWGPTMKLHF